MPLLSWLGGNHSFEVNETNFRFEDPSAFNHGYVENSFVFGHPSADPSVYLNRNHESAQEVKSAKKVLRIFKFGIQNK